MITLIQNEEMLFLIGLHVNTEGFSIIITKVEANATE
jgi:hypothetical protein